MKKIIILLILLVSIKLNAQVGIDSINNKTDSFYTFVRNWVGSPYRVGGVSIRGVDCSGFSLVLYQTVFKITLPRIAKEQYKKNK